MAAKVRTTVDNPLNERETSDTNAMATEVNEVEDIARNDSNEKPFNRFIFCLTAICLLWLTSLQFCVNIVDQFVTIPTIQSVFDTCSYSYSIADEQRKQFQRCARMQYKNCESDLSFAFEMEQSRVQDIHRQNQVFAKRFVGNANNCSSSVSNAKLLLQSWSNSGVEYTIPYLDQCAPNQRQKVASMIGDSSGTSTSAYSSSQQYSQASDNSVHRLATYTADLNRYNAQYVQNKTKGLQDLSVHIISDISPVYIGSLDGILDPMHEVVQQLVACVSLSANDAHHCELDTNAVEIYKEMQYIVNLRTNRVKTAVRITEENLVLFKAQVAVAIQNANDFYDSMLGPDGILTWMIQASQFLPSGNLCTKSTPNWCSFSKVCVKLLHSFVAMNCIP